MPVLTAANLVRLQREVDVPTAPAARPDVPAKALFVTPESADFLQAGGLGEVSAALPRALRPGCDARVLLPAYRPALRNVAAIDIVAHLPGAGAIPPCSIGALTLPDGLVVYLALCSELYDRDGSPYADAAGNEFGDNAIRFARLSLAAAELAMRGVNGWRPDVLHLNDWPTALAAGYLRWRGGKTPTVVSIHNLAHQGQFDASRLDDLAIPPSAFRLDGVEFYGRISFLKAGIVYADHVTTVCATYAGEIARPEFGCGLNGLLAQRANEGRLTGIRNGVDASWDPRADKRNPYRFDAHRWKERYADYVRGAFGLSLSAGPLFAFVARLVHQKGFDLVLEASETVVARGGQVVMFLLGANPGEPPAPLAKVASGGELSRAMLATRLVLSAAPPTLVFDEVDAGVGGEAALAVGRALGALGRDHQVLVVTHLAQVAAFADQQVLVSKTESEGRTVAGARPVTGNDRVVELSRMLSGHPDSAAARKHAKELLALGARSVTASGSSGNLG